MVQVLTRQLGRRRPLLADWSFDLPPDWGGDSSEPLTLRALIAKIVLLEVARFRARQIDKTSFRVLTAKEVEEGTVRGAVKPGSQAGIQEVDDDEAVAAALQAFEDGIYLVVLDGEEQRDLDCEVYLSQDSTITFIRLVMLAGA
ncbi:MAG: hypothetical protein WC655_21005 [Candidatus Hydrogenedentales bacterium]|jgi:hypothetical protein